VDDAAVTDDTSIVEDHIGIDDAVAPDNRTRVDHSVAPNLRSITDYRAEFLQAGCDHPVRRKHGDFSTVELHIGQDYTGAEVHLVTENRISDVAEVWDLRVVENNTVLEFAGVTHHDVVSDDDVLAHIAAAADVAVFSDPGGAFQHRALFHDCAAPDENGFADEWLSDQLPEDPWFQTKLQIARNLFECFPDVFVLFEKLRMRGVLEFEKFGRTQHIVRQVLLTTSASRDDLPVFRIPHIPAARL